GDGGDGDPPPVVSGGVFDVELMDAPDASTLPVYLEPVQDQTVSEGQAVSFVAHGYSDVEGTGLTYGLGPDAPSGARIDPTTGVFAWTPTAAGTFSITVLVTE